jgi:lysozyme
MGTRKALNLAAGLCKEYEGLARLDKKTGLVYPYICPAGYPTQGYGTVWRPDGIKVAMTDGPVSEATAHTWLMRELQRTYLAGVLKASPHLVAFPQALAGITSWAYNLGVPRYRASTMKRRVDEQDWEGAARECLRWNKAGGVVLRGLVRRREAEAKLIAEGR